MSNRRTSITGGNHWLRRVPRPATGLIDRSEIAEGWARPLDRKKPYHRYGYGVLDENLNGIVDPGEKRVYFEIGDFSHYVFFESPR